MTLEELWKARQSIAEMDRKHRLWLVARGEMPSIESAMEGWRPALRPTQADLDEVHAAAKEIREAWERKWGKGSADNAALMRAQPMESNND